MKGISIIILTLFFAQAEAGIFVESAFWGTKDVTSATNTFCKSSQTCTYKISSKFIGVHGGPTKSFKITWSCEGIGGSQKTTDVKADAENTILTFDCSNVQPILPTPAPKVALRKGLNLETVNYYKALLVRYKLNPSLVRLVDFNKTFFPLDQAPDVAKDKSVICNNGSYSGPCAPDTYYSWGPLGKMLSIKAATENDWDSTLNAGRLIYMSHTPIASWCYGEYMVRFKFRFPPTPGGAFGQGKYDLKEWTVKDAKDVESVSFAQPEHIDEIVTEYKRRMSSPTYHNVSLYSYHQQALYSGEASIIKGCLDERMQVTEQNLVRNLTYLLTAYFDNKGWVHSQGDKSEHFETLWPTFFNPK